MVDNGLRWYVLYIVTFTVLGNTPTPHLLCDDENAYAKPYGVILYIARSKPCKQLRLKGLRANSYVSIFGVHTDGPGAELSIGEKTFYVKADVLSNNTATVKVSLDGLVFELAEPWTESNFSIEYYANGKYVYMLVPLFLFYMSAYMCTRERLYVSAYICIHVGA